MCTVPQAIYISELRPEDTRAYVRWKIEAEDKCSTAVENFTVFCRQVEKVPPVMLYSKFTKRVIGVMVESVKLGFSPHVSKSRLCVSSVLVCRPICQLHPAESCTRKPETIYQVRSNCYSHGTHRQYQQHGNSLSDSETW